MLRSYTADRVRHMPRRRIGYNGFACLANLHASARHFAAKLRPQGRFPFLLIRPPGLESLNLSDGLPLELF